LSVAGAAYLAALPKAPNAYLFDRPDNVGRAQARRDWVLERMRSQGHVTMAGLDAARAERLAREP
jgi:penicillin-binding protein 1A